MFKHTLVGFMLDLVDWMLIGFLPGAGDIIDAVGAAYFYREVGIVGILPIIEFVPGFDALPTNLAMGIYADFFVRKEKN